MHGMKTATNADLIMHYEEEFNQKDAMRAQIKKEEKISVDISEKNAIVKEEKSDVSSDFEEEKSDIQLPDFSKSLEEDVPF